jgi:hypothetical protein
METCQFCSEISLNAGEDPIGTAARADHWFLIELSQPWARDLWSENRLIPTDLYQRLKAQVMAGNITLRPVAIAPETAYQQPGYRRIFYYYRPSYLFANYQKQEYLVPEAQVKDLVTAIFQQILGQDNHLSEFFPYQQPSPSRELLVCTHGNVDTACSRFGYPLYQTLRQQYSSGELRVWRCSHFGGHRFAPTAISLPEGRYWGHLTENVLDALVNHRGKVADVAPCLRGWAGLNQWAQIAEREIWLNQGWEWLHYLKAGEVLEEDEVNQEWARVRIQYRDPSSEIQGSYDADIVLTGEITTASKSGSPAKTTVVKQYQVKAVTSHLAIDWDS